MTLAQLSALVDRCAQKNADTPQCAGTDPDVPGLFFIRRTQPTEIEASVYDPLVCLILQGRKETLVGDRMVEVGAGSCIIVSHDLPVVARITEATLEVPYLALVARLDVGELRSLYDEVGPAALEAAPRAYAVGTIDAPLLDVLTRYVALFDDPDGVRVLMPMLRRELHFRLLRAQHGAMLRTLLLRDSHASNISKAIQDLRVRFREGVEVPALARSVGMSTSSFHKHFKDVTATTPLQYQKDLRLTEAQRLLLIGEHSVSTAAFEVGYESTTQFSREYSRKFGVPPSAHRRRQQLEGAHSAPAAVAPHRLGHPQAG